MKSGPKIESLLAQVFDELRERPRGEFDAAEYDRRRQDFVFHMTDWSSELKQLAALFECPEEADHRSASQLVVGFLYHVIPHLNAAGRLLLDEVPDPFIGSQG